jgi:hypothetical protein
MSRIASLDAADRMIFDLGPDEGVKFAEVKRAAADIAKILLEVGLKSWPLLLGGKGMHVVIPFDGARDYAETDPFAKKLAQTLASRDPNPTSRIGPVFEFQHQGKQHLDLKGLHYKGFQRGSAGAVILGGGCAGKARFMRLIRRRSSRSGSV